MTDAERITSLEQRIADDAAYIEKLFRYIEALRQSHPHPPTMKEAGCED